MYSVYSVVHINHELHIRGSSDAQRADTKLLSSIFHQLFKQHNRLQSAPLVAHRTPTPCEKIIRPYIQAIPHIRFPPRHFRRLHHPNKFLNINHCLAPSLKQFSALFINSSDVFPHKSLAVDAAAFRLSQHLM